MLDHTKSSDLSKTRSMQDKYHNYSQQLHCVHVQTITSLHADKSLFLFIMNHKHSPIWNYFTYVTIDGIKRAKCVICHHQSDANSKSWVISNSATNSL